MKLPYFGNMDSRFRGNDIERGNNRDYVALHHARKRQGG